MATEVADHDPRYGPRVKGKAMIGLFFEVIPLEGHASRYFELAAALRPELERSGGVLFIDRYTRAFSSEVGSGSRKENASKKNPASIGAMSSCRTNGGRTRNP
jgi:hypothetical protein